MFDVIAKRPVIDSKVGGGNMSSARAYYLSNSRMVEAAFTRYAQINIH